MSNNQIKQNRNNLNNKLSPITNKTITKHLKKAESKQKTSKDIIKNQMYTTDPQRMLLIENEKKWVQRKLIDDQIDKNAKDNYGKNKQTEKVGYLPDITNSHLHLSIIKIKLQCKMPNDINYPERINLNKKLKTIGKSQLSLKAISKINDNPPSYNTWDENKIINHNCMQSKTLRDIHYSPENLISESMDKYNSRKMNKSISINYNIEPYFNPFLDNRDSNQPDRKENGQLRLKRTPNMFTPIKHAISPQTVIRENLSAFKCKSLKQAHNIQTNDIDDELFKKYNKSCHNDIKNVQTEQIKQKYEIDYFNKKLDIEYENNKTKALKNSLQHNSQFKKLKNNQKANIDLARTQSSNAPNQINEQNQSFLI